MTPTTRVHYRALLIALALMLPALAAQAQTPPTGAQIAAAMEIPAADIATAENVAPLNAATAVRSKFGPNVLPQAGSSLAIMSTGTASSPIDPGYAVDRDHNVAGTYPPGFPMTGNACHDVPGAAKDMSQVAITLTVPPGIQGFAFDFNYYWKDYPQWACSQFGDGFAAIVESNGVFTNVSVDGMGNPIQANLVHFAETTGSPLLDGTGFEGHGATGWLTSAAPVAGGQTITLRFYIWDAGDGTGTSTVLLDNFRWLTQSPGGGGGGTPGTQAAVNAGPDLSLESLLQPYGDGSNMTFLADVQIAGQVSGAVNRWWSKNGLIVSNTVNYMAQLGVGLHTLTLHAVGSNGQEVTDSVVVLVTMPGGGSIGAGPQGPQGVAGPMGPAGPAGADGPIGPPGVDGQQGPAGATGATGAKGDKGAKGAKGDKGDKGAPGTMPSGTVVFVMPGDPAPQGYTLIATFKQLMDLRPSRRGGNDIVEVRVYRKN